MSRMFDVGGVLCFQIGILLVLDPQFWPKVALQAYLPDCSSRTMAVFISAERILMWIRVMGGL